MSEENTPQIPDTQEDNVPIPDEHGSRRKTPVALIAILVVAVIIIAIAAGIAIPKIKAASETRERFKRAADLILVREFEAAMDVYKEEMLTNPRNADVYIKMAELNFLQARSTDEPSYYNQAQEKFQKLLSVDHLYATKVRQIVDAEVEKYLCDDEKICPYDLMMLAVEYNKDWENDDRFCYYYGGLFETADQAIYDEFVAKFPVSKYNAEILIRVADNYYYRESFSKAKELYQQVTDEYPDTEPRKQAEDRLNEWCEVYKRVLPHPGLTTCWTHIKLPFRLRKGEDYTISAYGNIRAWNVHYSEWINYQPEGNNNGNLFFYIGNKTPETLYYSNIDPRRYPHSYPITLTAKSDGYLYVGSFFPWCKQMSGSYSITVTYYPKD